MAYLRVEFDEDKLRELVNAACEEMKSSGMIVAPENVLYLTDDEKGAVYSAIQYYLFEHNREWPGMSEKFDLLNSARHKMFPDEW